tara:strand:- start:144 stop:1451 length:1308 start_codon:yes stop_codon:yes gene_type:complete
MLKSSKVDNGINGEIIIPGDKSISHRSIIIPSISNGVTEVSNLLWSEDVISTLNAFKAMGVKISKDTNKLKIVGKGLNSLSSPKNNIDLGNSGTSARLLTGLLAGQNFNSTIIGDESLSSRPMVRIVKPLELMGAKIKTNEGKLPIKILGQKLKNLNYNLELPSAQVKSGIILAALNVDGLSQIIEKNITRDHTEKMLSSFGAHIKIQEINESKKITIKGKKELKPQNISVPSDLSSAAFFIVAALINKNSKIRLLNINLNPTRTGIITALKKMGGNIKISNLREINNEIVGDIDVESSDLKGCELGSDMARLMIDEYPILSIAASFAKTSSLFKNLKELRVKESDRLELIRLNLVRCGVYCEIKDDDLFIDPIRNKIPNKNIIKTDSDHRIAMSFAIMGTKLGTSLKIEKHEYIKTSFPNFIEELNRVGGNLTE